jgi:WD40 repeat protein
MAVSWKTLRVFISSTFRDMQAERDHLVRFVFPRLREELLRRRIHLIDVDLRWGVTSDQDAVSICREVIDECHPRFMGMLGGRYGWIPDGHERSITEDEVHYGVLEREAEIWGNAVFYFRDGEVTASIAEETPGDFREPEGSENARKLADLKQSIIDAGLPAFTYRAQWDALQKRLTGLEAFGDHVYAHLLKNIRDDPELDDHFLSDTTTATDEFADEREAMEAFIEDRTERYVVGSRQPLLDQMTAFAAAHSEQNILVIAGEPGSGKSSLLGKYCQLPAIQKPGLVIPHFVGASAGSTDLRRTLRRLCHELAATAGHGDPLPEDIRELIDLFRKLLGAAAAQQRVIVILDAINQFDAAGGAHDMTWLPQELPPNVRIIASSLEHPALEALRHRSDPVRIEKLGALSHGDTLEIIQAFLQRYSKRLSPPQVAGLMNKPESHLPLYVLTALQELRTLGTYEEITGRIQELPGEVKSLFGWILKARLSNDPGFRDAESRPCGAALVAKFASYLGLSRRGLSQEELVGLIDPGDPLGNVAALIRLLRPYLMLRGQLLDFFHGQLREAVFEHYISQAHAATLHSEMAGYFVTCAKGNDPAKEWETDSVRGFSECVFHLTKAGQYDLARSLLSNFPFLLHKLRVGLLDGVYDDYEIFRREAPAEWVKQLEIWSGFFREKAHMVRRGNEDWPAHRILFQLAIEHADDSPLAIAAEQWLAGGRCQWLWLRRVSRPLHARKKLYRAVLEGHTDWVAGVLVLADGRLLSWSGDKTLRIWDSASGACLVVLEGHTGWVKGAQVLADGRLLSWSSDKTLRFWNDRSGACLAVFHGYTSNRNLLGAQVLAGERLLLWVLHSSQANSSQDRTLRLWDCQAGACLAVLEGHAHAVAGALGLADGRLLSWSLDHTLRLWDGQNGACLAVLEGHSDWIVGALALADGRLLSWSGDKTLRIWNSASGAYLTALEGHTGNVEGALDLADGRLLSWSYDHTLRIWDGQNGACLVVLEGHTDWVKGAQIMADGRLLSWSGDKTLRIWDSTSGACLAILEGHTGRVEGAQVLADGRLLSWSVDRTLLIWNGQNGACLAVPEGHTGNVEGAQVLADGRLLSWGNDLCIWNGQSCQCLSVLEGHTDRIEGAQVLADGRLLSWSRDKTLRLWDGRNGACLVVLEGHTDWVSGAQIMADGRLLSWSSDQTLRIWDCASGACLAVLEGHTASIEGAQVLTDGRLLSCSNYLRIWDSQTGACQMVLRWPIHGFRGALDLGDGRLFAWSTRTLRIWDIHSGACLAALNEGYTGGIAGAVALKDGRLLFWSNLEVFYLWDGHSNASTEIVPLDQVASRHPDWLQARRLEQHRESVVGNFSVDASARSARLHHTIGAAFFAVWNAESDLKALCLVPDGTVVFTQNNGEICFLKLYHGNRRISLAEAGALLQDLPMESA